MTKRMQYFRYCDSLLCTFMLFFERSLNVDMARPGAL